jgi:hypothetical protein
LAASASKSKTKFLFLERTAKALPWILLDDEKNDEGFFRVNGGRRSPPVKILF